MWTLHVITNKDSIKMALKNIIMVKIDLHCTESSYLEI